MYTATSIDASVAHEFKLRGRGNERYVSVVFGPSIAQIRAQINALQDQLADLLEGAEAYAMLLSGDIKPGDFSWPVGMRVGVATKPGKKFWVVAADDDTKTVDLVCHLSGPIAMKDFPMADLRPL